MNVNIRVDNITLSNSLRDYVNKCVSSSEKLLDEKARSSALYEVQLSRQTHHNKGDVFSAEINLSVDGELFCATAEGESIEASIDEVKDELVRELRKNKTKQMNFLRKGGERVKAWMRGLSG